VIQIAINVVVVVSALLVQLLMLDDYIRRLIKRELARMCGECDYRNLKSPKSQKIG